MPKKIFTLFIFLFSILFMTACSKEPIPSETNEPTVPIVVDQTIKSIEGLEHITITQHDYFNPLEGVVVINESDKDISHLFEVTGHIPYGVVGEYTLSYQLSYGDSEISQSRTISVVSGTIQRPLVSRNTLQGTAITQESGSYRINSAPEIAHPIKPQRFASNLLDSAVPSNGWWTSLLVSNYGGGNGIYTNPLRSAFSNAGAEITNPGAGFVQYWNPAGFNTMANFSLALPDLYLKTTNLNAGYETHVIDYSDTTVQVAMRNVGDLKDQMVLSYTQGSPYVFAEVSSSSSPYITLAQNGVSGFEFYTAEGERINGSTHIGSNLVIRFVNKHIGYQTSRPAQVGQPIYGDRYFLVSTPDESTFGISTSNISMTLNGGNYFSITPINALADAPFFHEHAYMKPLKGDVSYTVNHEESIVETDYYLAVQDLKNESSSEVIQYLLPHHYLMSDAVLETYTFETVRGFLKLMIGNHFKTTHSFHGLIPAMTLPQNTEFSESNMTSYLQDLDTRTEIADTSNFLNEEGPYWNSKALYPLAQGIIIADQTGDDLLKDSFIEKLRYLLSDWFTFTSSADKRYLYYNESWGSVYYSNNDFNTASELSDHAFTHGYLVYASSILAMYDQTFEAEYGHMVDLLLSDYMHYEKDSYDFAYLRSFDPWAGHTWAHGFGSFAEGNNIESSSEAIQSWVGGYLWALKRGDQELMDAAIYGFVHELNSAKVYMFDYHDIVFKDQYEQYASVAGMIWGGKYDYATWFGANPTFIYGIQWLPNGEYISNYALNDVEYNRLDDIFADYLLAKNQTIDTWFANMWSIQALLNPNLALSQFNANKILTDDYPSDLSQTYYLLNGLKTFGRRTTSYVMEIHPHVASSIYVNDAGQIYALIWNSSSSEQDVVFNGPSGQSITITVGASSFHSHLIQ
jgi:endo-1,3(4)-beta-glucanase